LERGQRINNAEAMKQALALKLDRAIAQGSDPGSRLRLLDAELVTLGLADEASAPVPRTGHSTRRGCGFSTRNQATPAQENTRFSVRRYTSRSSIAFAPASPTTTRAGA
jgi:hypothetical protein